MNRAFLLTSAAILTPTSVFADTNAEETVEATSSAEITVTGLRQKFRGTLAADDIPQAIQEVPRELIDQQGITELTDALILAPGFSRQNNYGGAYDAYAVRGFVGNPNVPSPYLINGYSALGLAASATPQAYQSWKS